MPRPRLALANKAPASPASGVLEPETLSLRQTSEPPRCWNRRKLLKLALSMRDKTGLQITGKRLALPVCVPSEGAPAPRRRCRCCRRGTLRGARAQGHRGTPFPLPHPAAEPAASGMGRGRTWSWWHDAVGQHPQPERGGHASARSWGPPRYPPPFWGPRGASRPHGAAGTAARRSLHHTRTKPRSAAGGHSLGHVPIAGLCPVRAAPTRGRAEDEQSPFAGTSLLAELGGHVRAMG